MDASGGPAWTKWFIGGHINLTYNCVDRHAASDRADVVAIIGEQEDGAVRQLTYAELGREVDRIAAGLRSIGVRKGDRVAVFMPMVIEAVVAAYAIAKLGAVYMPIFSGFAPSAVAARLQDSEAKVIFTADGGLRRGTEALMKPARRRGGGRVAVGEERDRARAPRRRRADDSRPRHDLGRAARARREGRAGRRRARGHGSRGRADDRLHLRHHRQAEGRRPRARRLPREDGLGDRLPDRPAPGRDALLGHRHGLDHGPVGDGRRGRARRDGGPVRGRAGLAGAGPRMGVGRAAPGQRARCVADADPLAEDQGRRARHQARPLEPARVRLDR